MTKVAQSSKPVSPLLTLPSDISILGKPWKIKIVDDDLDSGNAANCDLRKRIINISSDEDMAEDAVDAILHECIHALCHYGFLELGDREEQVVAVLATGLVQVLSANPDLANWVYANLPVN